MGAFVATILMVQLAFEEFLRSQYRTSRGVGGKVDSGIAVDKAGFADLIKQARSDDFLSDSEADELNDLREHRNPYVHVKDTDNVRNKGRTFLDQLTKIAAPDFIGVSTEDEAKKAIQLLIRLFPTLCMRM